MPTFLAPVEVTTATNHVAVGANPAQFGSVRIPTDSSISWRNWANTGDIRLAQTGPQDGIATVNASYLRIDGNDAYGAALWGTASHDSAPVVGVRTHNRSTVPGVAGQGSIVAFSCGSQSAITTYLISAWEGTGETDASFVVGNRSANVVNERFRVTSAGNIRLVPGASITTIGTGFKLGASGSDLVGHWGSTPIVQPTSGTAIDTLLTNTGLRASGGTANFATAISTAGDSVSIGTNPAQTGSLRIPNLGIIYGRNVANTGDVAMMYVDTNDRIRVNPLGAELILSGPVRLGFNTAQTIGFWGVTPAAQNTGWAVTAGYTSSKSFNPETASLLQSNRVLGTLIDILKAYGLLGA